MNELIYLIYVLIMFPIFCIILVYGLEGKFHRFWYNLKTEHQRKKIPSLLKRAKKLKNNFDKNIVQYEQWAGLIENNKFKIYQAKKSRKRLV